MSLVLNNHLQISLVVDDNSGLDHVKVLVILKRGHSMF